MGETNVWSNFDKIVCINLDKRTDRWANVQNEFKKVNVLERVERFSAVAFFDGRVGLMKSLLAIFRQCKEQNVKNVLIFEDDVEFINNPIETLQLAIAQANRFPWSMLYLGATTWTKHKIVAPNLIRLRQGLATHAVAYRSDVFDLIINQFEKTNEIRNEKEINDVFLMNLQMSKYTLLTNPMIAIQTAGYSDLQKRKVNYNFMVKQFENNFK